MHAIKAEITEIFSSIQGEGIFVGAKQIFVRFRQCNLACAYCDEPWKNEPRLLSALELMTEVNFLRQSRGHHHSVSLTGGEPLMYADFLKVFLKLLRREGFKAYLETNGTMPEELAGVIDLVDIVAMDFKLPSSTGLRAYWEEHFEFLKIAAKKDLFVKIVVTPATTKADVERSVEIIKGLKKEIPLIIQPATPVAARDRAVDNGKLLEFLEIGSKHSIEGIRVIPQVHKMLGVK